MIDIVKGASVFEGMREEGPPVSDHVPDLCRGPGIAGGICEVGSVVCEDGVDLVGDGVEKQVSAGLPVFGLDATALPRRVR